MSVLRVERFAMLDSTNLHARRQVESGALVPDHGPVVYIAAEQSGGIGRLGRAWSSPCGGLWMTLACAVDPGRAGLPTLGLRIGAACLAAVLRVMREKSTAGRAGEGDVRLKWPNDVLIRGRKVLGVLCETVRPPVPAAGAGTWVLVGVGVNANFPAGALPAGLRRPPTTLLDELGREVDLESLREDLCGRLLPAVNDPGPAAALALARERLFGRGEPVSLHMADGPAVRGTLVDLSEEGLPVVRTAAGDVVAPPGAELRAPAEEAR